VDSVEFLVWLGRLRSGVPDLIFVSATWLGTARPYMALLIVIYLCVEHRLGFGLLLMFLVSAYSNGQLKMAFDTPRPFEARPELFANALRTDWAHGGSFPSGHAQNAAVVWGIIASWQEFWLTRAAIVALIAVISFSRLYCQVHWPMDVIGGLVIGACLLIVYLTVVQTWGSGGTWMSRGQWAVVVIAAAAMMYLFGLMRLRQPGFDIEDVDACLRSSGALLGAGLGYLLLLGRGYRAQAPPLKQALKIVIALVTLFGVRTAAAAVLGETPWGWAIGFTVIGFTGTYLLPVFFTQSPIWCARIRGCAPPAAQSEDSE